MTLSRRACLVLPAAGLAAGSSARSAAAGGGRTFGEMVGLGVKFSQGQPESELQALLELRVRWVRDALHWPQIEPAPGRYAPLTPALQRQLAFYRRHDIGVVALLTLGNARAYGEGDRRFDPDAFGRFAAEAARQLAAAGVRFVLEVGNEPHNSPLARHFGGAWNGRPPSPWLQHYLRMVHAAVRDVRAFDPSLRVLVDDDMWLLHHRFIEAGVPRALAGFAVHPYTPGPPERTAVAHDTDWTRPFTVVDRDRSFGSAVRRLREAAAPALDRRPEVWITEWGWAAERSAPHGVDEATVAAYLPRAFMLADAAGIEALCWFSAHDAVDGPMGLVRHGGARRAAFTAFATMTAQLQPMRLQRHHVHGELHACRYADGNRRLLAAWSADGRARRLPWPARAIAAGVDGLGRALRIDDPADPAVQIDASVKYLPIDEPDHAVERRLAQAAT